MNRLKPRVPLDKNILERINEYYGWRLGHRVLYRECFSHPALDMHSCNPLARLEGGDKCSYCNHAPGGICKITCHVNRYCLAVFAFRLGLGGSDVFNKAMKTNLGMSYQNLYKKVDALLNEVQADDGTAQDLSAISTETTERNSSGKKKKKPAKKKPAKKKPKETFVDDKGRELVDIPEAAKLYGCSYHNMYVHVMERENLEKVPVPVGDKKGKPRVFVRKEDVLKMKEKKEKKKRKKGA